MTLRVERRKPSLCELTVQGLFYVFLTSSSSLSILIKARFFQVRITFGIVLLVLPFQSSDSEACHKFFRVATCCISSGALSCGRFLSFKHSLLCDYIPAKPSVADFVVFVLFGKSITRHLSRHSIPKDL